MARYKRPREYHAKLEVIDLPNMKKAEVKKLSEWLRVIADDLELSPKEYDENFTAKLMN